MNMPILAWARTPVAPVGGALAHCQPHELAAPLVARLLADTGLPAQAVDAVVLGNALGAGGNPARLLALAAGLNERIPAITLDSQCCAGLDAITHACGLLALGQAQVVIAGGAEAWSRAPLRMHRPASAGAAPVPYEQAALHALARARPRTCCRPRSMARGAWACPAPRRMPTPWPATPAALAARAEMAAEIVPINGLCARRLSAQPGRRARRACPPWRRAA